MEGGATRLSALLFDLDGVLVDSVPAYVEAWSAWAVRFGVDPAEIWSDAHGRRPEDIMSRVAPTLGRSRALAAFDEFFSAVVARGVVPYPGAVDLLQALPCERWCIVTSARRSHVSEILGAVGLPMPDHFVCGEDVARGKPDPSCWELGARRLGAEVVGCVVVEDAPAGIEGARAAGARSIAITTTHPRGALSRADCVFDSLLEAVPYILRA
jgi:sugar-phosphatase